MKRFYIFITSLIFISINTFSQRTNSFENALDFLVDIGDSVIYSLDGNVALYANVISVTGEKIKRFDWDINGDNVIDTTTTSPNLLFKYNNPGIYWINVFVYGEYGNYSYDAVQVNVGNIKEKPLDFYFDKIDAGKSVGTYRNTYVIMINGCVEDRFWDSVEEFYQTLTDIHNIPDNQIYLFNYNGLNPDGVNPNNMIDYAATKSNITTVLNNLSNDVSENDIVLLWITGHGSGYYGDAYYNVLKRHVLLSQASVEQNDEQDYLENNLKLRVLYTGGIYQQKHGMNQWCLYKYPTSDNASYYYYRNRFVSRFSNLQLENGTPVSDSDVYIEKQIDYLRGDYNKNGIIETSLGEIYDYDNDGMLPYNASTGIFDEGDWGLIDSIEDNYNYIEGKVPGGTKYVLFDKNFDNHIDIDINPGCVIGNCVESSLVADGTDLDNDGDFDRIDVNQDGDFQDWVSIDEFIRLYGSNLVDDELKELLRPFKTKNMVIALSSCFSGGFIDDISKKGRVILTATTDEITSFGSHFVDEFNYASSHASDADSNSDGEVSFCEIFNYILGHDYSDYPLYDDNGDAIAHHSEIPISGDGCLGSTISYNKILLPNITISNTEINTDATYQANTINVSNSIIKNNSNVIFNVSDSVTIDANTQINIGSTLIINNSQCP